MKQKKQQQEMDRPLEFLDCIAPSIIRFQTDHCILGSSYRCYWALKEYPTSTDEQAILRHLGNTAELRSISMRDRYRFLKSGLF